MKTTTLSLLTAAVAASLAGSACAMDTQVYGVVDLGVHWTDSQASDTSSFTMDSGITKGSRVGLRGGENLGNGYGVIFNLETGFTADTGEFDNTKGRLFNRGASLGVTTPWGKAEFGRLGALGSGVTGSIFLNAVTPFGNLYKEAQALQIINHQVMRADNMVRLESASMAGVKLYAEYSNGVDGDDAVPSSERDRFAALGAAYQNGPLSLVFVADNYFYEDTKYPAYGRDDSQTFNFGARWRVKDVTLYAAYQHGRHVEKVGNQMKKPGGTKDAYKESGTTTITQKTTSYDTQGFNSNAWVLGLKTKLWGGDLKLQTGYARGTADSDKVVTTVKVKASSGQVKSRDVDAERTHVKADVWQIAAAYNYPLSKSAYLYAAAAYVDRTYKENGEKVRDSAKSDRVKSLMAGLCYTF